ncbi:hypothetical protein ACJX0J_033415, partial [Zea mays]
TDKNQNTIRFSCFWIVVKWNRNFSENILKIMLLLRWHFHMWQVAIHHVLELVKNARDQWIYKYNTEVSYQFTMTRYTISDNLTGGRLEGATAIQSNTIAQPSFPCIFHTFFLWKNSLTFSSLLIL